MAKEYKILITETLAKEIKIKANKLNKIRTMNIDKAYKTPTANLSHFFALIIS